MSGNTVARLGAERKRVAMFALLGSSITLAWATLAVHTGGFGWLGFVQPGSHGPSAAVFHEDFPGVSLQPVSGHDGQQFYAIAREIPDLGAASTHLDRPRYRLQRPLFPILTRALFPPGTGWGLVASTVVVGALSLFGLGVAAGALSLHLGGPSWVAFATPMLPGSFFALRLGVADNLALALLLGTLVASERRRTTHAVLAAIAAVLAKEAVLVAIVGHALIRRTRTATSAAFAAIAAGGIWWLILRVAVDVESAQIVEFSYPFGGIVGNVDIWLHYGHRLSAVTVIGTLLLAAVLLVIRPVRHPLYGALLALAVLSSCLSSDVLGLDQNGTRTIGPLLVVSGLVALTPNAGSERLDPAESR